MTSPTTPTTSWAAAPSPSGNNGRPAPSPTIPPATPPQPSPTRTTANPATTQQLPVVGQPIIQVVQPSRWTRAGAILGAFAFIWLFISILPISPIMGVVGGVVTNLVFWLLLVIAVLIGILLRLAQKNQSNSN